MRSTISGLALLTLLACSAEKGAPNNSEADPGGEDTAPPEDSGAPDAPSAQICDRVLGGPATDSEPVIAFSEAHAAFRLFGPSEDFRTPDLALIEAIAAGDPLKPDAATYAAALSLCLVEAQPPLGEGSLRQVGELALIQPGTGAHALPDGVSGVVIDLRDLPEDPALPAALAAAVAPALADDLTPTRWKVRQWEGFVDQVFSASNAYSTRLKQVSGPDLDATGGAALPIVLVTGPRLAPSAAAFAVALSERAWIVGEDVMSAVGELGWSPLGDEGMLWKKGQLRGPEGDVPDTLPATLRTEDPEAALEAADLSTWAAPAAPTGEATSAPLPNRDPYDEELWGEESDAATFAADLILLHGVVRNFFPYFEVSGDGIDARLLELLAAPATDRDGQRQAIGRFGEVLHDGHVFFGDFYRDDVEGYLPVRFDYIDGRPVVVHSSLETFQPGDTLTAVDGVEITAILDEWRSWHGAATEGYTTDLAGRELLTMRGDTTYTLEDPDGLSRDERVSPQPSASLSGLTWVFQDRGNGMLDDLGAPDIAYLNLSDEVTTSLSEVQDLLDAAAGARGLVVDMRGYPGVDHYQVASALIEDPFPSPFFNVPVWTGPSELEVDSSYYSLSPDAAPFTGPIVLLTSPVTVSAAENFSMMLVGAHRVTVVGRSSAGTNGNITGARLPGGFYMSFTGMEVLFPDGSTFHGVAITPDVEVSPTAADYRDGKDPELETAIAVLGGGARRGAR